MSCLRIITPSKNVEIVYLDDKLVGGTNQKKIETNWKEVKGQAGTGMGINFCKISR